MLIAERVRVRRNLEEYFLRTEGYDVCVAWWTQPGLVSYSRSVLPMSC